MPNGHRYAGSEGSAAVDAEVWRSPGKRTLTDSLQRKATDAAAVHPLVPTPAASAQAPDVNGLSCEQSFLDSILDGPVQRKADAEAATEHVRALADAGTAGSGGALPFLDQIQASFGAHDVGGVQAHTDGAAADAAAGMGATAFARGSHVAFAGAADLHTAAHEAAHVVQQRAGVHLKGGVGAEGDHYEQHADAVADAVVRGESAEALLGPVAGAGTGAAVQRKGEKKDDKKDDGPELPDGEMATMSDYTSNMIAGSTSMEIAHVGDAAGRTAAGGEDMLLPRIHIDAKNSYDLAELLRKRAVKHDDAQHRKNSDKFMKEAESFERGNDYYNQFVPQGNFAVKAVMRFKAMKEELAEVSPAFGEDVLDVGARASGHDKGLKAGIQESGVKTQQGTVTTAASMMDGARQTFMSTIEGFRRYLTGTVLTQLREQLDKATKDKAAIEARIEAVSGFISTVGGLMSGGAPFVGDGVDPSNAGDVVGAAGTLVGFGMQIMNRAELDRLQQVIGNATAAIEQYGEINASREQHGFVSAYNGARKTYEASVEAYQSAIASRRAQYADIGTTADLTENGGRAPKRDKDVNSQTMLYVSSARETHSIVTTALLAAREAERELRAASKSADYRRSRLPYNAPDLDAKEREGKPSLTAVGDALGNVFRWIDATEEELPAIKQREAAAQGAMAKLGSAGKY